MKTALGKLVTFGLLLLSCVILFAPMRAGIEDRISFSVKELTLSQGQRAELPYELQTSTAQTVSFASDDLLVARIDQGGVVTAISPGRAHIRVTAQSGVYDELTLTVEGVPVTTITLNAQQLEMVKGEVSGLTVSMNPGADPEEVVWSSRDPNVAQVDRDGRVQATGGGETDIVVRTASGLAAVAHVRVRVPAEQVWVTPDDLHVGVGSAIQMRTRFFPTDSTDTPRNWVSSDPDIVSIDASGRMQARQTGTARVSVATAQGLTASSDITVEPAMSDLALNVNDLTLERGETAFLVASLIDEAGQPKQDVRHHIEWESADPSVANVEEGTIHALSTGTTVISASADGYRAVCTVHVRTSVRSVSLDIDKLYLLREQTDEPIRLTATVEPADADDTSIGFVSDNDLVATVDADGVVTLTGGYGTANITARASNGLSDTFTVHVVVDLPTGSYE